jgi:predicted RNA-binding Zn ribbon-like protein
MVSQPSGLVFKQISGRVCLDFLNTLDGARGGHFLELLSDYGALLEFSRQIGLAVNSEVDALARRATRQGRQAGQVVDRAIELREAGYRLIVAAHQGQPPPGADLERLNAELAGALGHARLSATQQGFGWEWENDDDALDRPLWPLARDIADLLAGPDLGRVAECHSDACTWLFLDTTKNHRRRWCQMEVCGNRAKAARHRAKKSNQG